MAADVATPFAAMFYHCEMTETPATSPLVALQSASESKVTHFQS